MLGTNQWPTQPADFREKYEAWVYACSPAAVPDCAKYIAEKR